MKRMHFCTPAQLGALSRRQLLQAGMTVSGYLCFDDLLGRNLLRAQSSAAESFTLARKLVWIELNGGWDILEATEPKPSSTSGIDMIYDYGLAPTVVGSDGVRLGRWLTRTAEIGSDLLLVRGMAVGTTSHNAGRIYMDTGVLSNAGRVNAASIPAIVASHSQATIPLIQGDGGADPQTDRGLLKPVSVVRAQNLNLYRSMYPSGDEAREERLSLLKLMKESVDRLRERSGSSDRITELETAMAKIQVQMENNIGAQLALTTADTQPFTTAATQASLRSGRSERWALALKLLKNDLVSCVNIGLGGFDTHSNQTASLQPLLTELDVNLRVFVDELRSAGKLDSTLIVLYSDFGRTPKINRSNGRDHWPVGSALMIGGGIAGARSVGATDDNLQAQNVNFDTGLLDSSGNQLNPTHLGGSVLALTLGSGYLKYRAYLQALPSLTKLK